MFFTGNNFSTFGEDFQKELYIAAVNNNKIYKVTTTSLNTEETKNKKITIYPNPASGKIFADGLKSKNNSVEIINIEGKKVLDTKVNEDGSIDISQLNSGVYFVTIKSENIKIYSQKLVVK